MSYGLTVRDAIDHVRNWLGGEASTRSHIHILQGILSAYRDLTTWREWKYLIKTLRINIDGAFDDGTVAYNSTTRQLTLTSGTWPSWAGDGEVTIGLVTANVERRLSDTVLVMDEDVTFSGTIASGTSYTLTHSAYTLPNDFQSSDQILSTDSYWQAVFVQPRDWLFNQRTTQTTGDPTIWTIMGDRNDLHRMALYLYPAPSGDTTIDMLIRRRPRELTISGYEASHYAGLVTCSGSTATVSGSDTEFAANMEGSILRVSTNAADIPGPRLGPHPYVVEAAIRSVASSTSLTVKGDIGSAFTDMKYVISDPIDIDPGMTEAFLRGCERAVGIQRRATNIRELDALYRDALYTAEANDARSGVPRHEGATAYARRLADYPMGADDTA